MRLGIFSVVDHYPNHIERSIEQFYAELLEQGRQADRLGFESFWIAEHHFHEYGVVPRPALVLAALASCTTRIRLGAAVVVLPFDSPLRVAEDFAMVDILSGGRLVLGVGSGYLQHEFEGFNISPEEKRERFDESLEVILQAWSGRRFSFSGNHVTVRNVMLNTVPLQKPHPEVAVAVLRNQSAPFVGAKQRPIVTIPYATTDEIEELQSTVSAFRSAFVNAGGASHKARAYFGLHTYCAATTAQARSECRQWMDRYVQTRLYAKQRSFETLIEHDLIACGDPEEILRVANRYELAGMTDFLAITNFGGMPCEKTLASMSLLANEVLPKLSESDHLEEAAVQAKVSQTTQ